MSTFLRSNSSSDTGSGAMKTVKTNTISRMKSVVVQSFKRAILVKILV